jgi:hypothetical protein
MTYLSLIHINTRLVENESAFSTREIISENKDSIINANRPAVPCKQNLEAEFTNIICSGTEICSVAWEKCISIVPGGGYIPNCQDSTLFVDFPFATLIDTHGCLVRILSHSTEIFIHARMKSYAFI